MIYYSTECKVLVKKDIVIKEFSYDNKELIQIHNDLDKYRLTPKLKDVIVKPNRWLYIIERVENIDEPIRKKKPKTNNQYFSLLDDYFGNSLPDGFYEYEKELLLYGYSLCDFHVGNFGFIGKQLVCIDEGCFIKEDDDIVSEMIELFCD